MRYYRSRDPRAADKKYLTEANRKNKLESVGNGAFEKTRIIL